MMSQRPRRKIIKQPLRKPRETKSTNTLLTSLECVPWSSWWWLFVLVAWWWLFVLVAWWWLFVLVAWWLLLSSWPWWFLFQQHSRALDLLAAQRAEEVRHEPVHQLEVRRQRRRILLRVVEDLFTIALGVQRRAGTPVDEDELRPQDETFALHVGAHGHHAAALKAVVDLLIALHVSRARVRREEHRAGDDQRILKFFADALPVRGVREEALVRLEIFFFLDLLRQRDALRRARGSVSVRRRFVLRRRD